MSFDTPNSALQVANSILQRSLDEKDKNALITHLKLQKLLYILHGWHLAMTDKPAFEDEVEAWAYGPVVRDVYYAFKDCGDKPIEDLGKDSEGDQKCVVAREDFFNKVLSIVWEKYKNIPSFDLVNATHARGTPWDWARENDEKIIANSVIRDHYKELLGQYENKSELAEAHA